MNLMLEDHDNKHYLQKAERIHHEWGMVGAKTKNKYCKSKAGPSKTRSISFIGLHMLSMNCTDPLRWSETGLQYGSACLKVEGSWAVPKQPSSEFRERWL